MLPEISKEQYIIIIVTVLCIIFGTIFSLYKAKNNITQSAPISATVKVDDSASRNVIKQREQSQNIVQITGAVVRPGVYSLSSSQRLVDLIKMCGLKASADISQINLAQTLTDGSKIDVPYMVFSYNSQPQAKGQQTKTIQKVNINTSDSAMLDSIPGVGPTTAQKIVEYRTQKGRFISIDQLAEVKGFSKKKVEKIKEYLTL